jgi:hypothetical protein
MKLEALAVQEPSTTTGGARHWRGFAVLLALVLVAVGLLTRPMHYGDFPEYALTTVALANHAGPDIRLSDVAAARPLLPQFGALDPLADGMRAGAQVPLPGFYRGGDGGYYAIHFFAYPALAAVPFKLLQSLGLNPFRCFQAVNLGFVFVLGMALLRLFGTPQRAALGVLAYLLCGGMLYLQWSSPESMSATALLAGLVLFCTGAPLAGGVLAGLAAMHNPPIVFFCAFAPVLLLCVQDQPGRGMGARLKLALQPRYLAGLAATAAMFAVPFLFNLHTFGMPSVIARFSTDPNLATLHRLHSFFLDLNQGVLVGVPAVAAALAAWALTRQVRALALCAAVCAFSIAMAVPALVAQNWNSGSAGIMRYALWGSMPLLFAFLWRLRLAPRWPVALLAVVLGGQALAMANVRRYNELEWSPLAARAIELAPGWYNPDPEIFYERTAHREMFPERERIHSYVVDGKPVKILFHISNQSVDAQVCGPNARLAPGQAYVEADMGWRYINGSPRCVDAAH